ncbi:MAG: Maf family protein, partial [Lachnospiraceae bacterium]|nr:Maf family protein [Lachnospiraceae bacterium]
MSERIVLASGSPRRRELLTQIGIRFEVIPALSEERTAGSDPAEICRSLASAKAEEVAQRILDARTACISQKAGSCERESDPSGESGKTPGIGGPDPDISRETAVSRNV